MKKKNTVAGIITLAIGVITAILSGVFGALNLFEFTINVGDFVLAGALILYGIVLMLVRIKGYGWLYPVIFAIIGIPHNIIKGEINIPGIITVAVIAVLSAGMFVFKLLRKK